MTPSPRGWEAFPTPGASPTLGSLGPSHRRRHKSRVSLQGPLCAYGVLGIPHGEVRDRKGGFGRGRGKRTYKRGGHRWGTESGRKWLDHMSGMNGLITIRGIRKMYDNLNTRFNLDTNGGRGVESGSRRIRRGADFCGDLWPRLRDSIDSVFTSREFPLLSARMEFSHMVEDNKEVRGS
jgi:hypothetical protein